MAFQRIIQSLSFCLFLTALVIAPDDLLSLWPADGFLRMDPIACLGTGVADRRFPASLWVAGMVLLLCAVLGRFFCAYLCPMGIAIDITDRLLRSPHKFPSLRERGRPRRFPARPFKYKVLAFILGAGGLGISLVFFASPLSLITRFCTLVLYPVFTFIADLGLSALRPVADALDLTAMAYAVVKPPRYDLQWVSVVTFLAIVAGGLWAPRFWCRFLCPSGALMAIFSRRPLLRRHVSSDCTQCGLCTTICPMDAIGDRQASDVNLDARLTDHAECIACLSCVRSCPLGAISFACAHDSIPGRQNHSPANDFTQRRRLLGAGLSGAAAAIITLTGLKSPHTDPGPGSIVQPSMIRPPGAVPENAFLARCIRCGACMQACPTNSLQPLGLAAGLSAVFSPVVTPRRGPCDPSCIACGSVCPTGAIAPLPGAEKLKAKIGTARILRQKCLAWELGKKCLICDEVCPFDAVEFRKLPGNTIAVPFVNENKCAGCGFCEHYCPVRATPAIVVAPMLALRLLEGSYRVAARQRGYILELGRSGAAGYRGPPNLHPGQLDENGLPPGFTHPN